MKWWDRKKKEPPAPVVQVRQGAGHPFGLLDRYTPLQPGEARLYRAIREFGLYRWEDQAEGQDRVRKEHDHAMDEIRYFAATVAGREELRDVVSAGVVERRRF